MESKSPLRSLVKSGTKLWLDSIDPELVLLAKSKGATGATSNPIIIANLINSGRWDDEIRGLAKLGHSAHDVTWLLTDKLVTQAEEVFQNVFEETKGNDGYVSFELDPIIESPQASMSIEQKIRKYVELGKKWSKNHKNRLIKIPATEAGIGALTELASLGIKINVTLIFTMSQYLKARDAIYLGLEKLADKSSYKSTYSIFVSRLDTYSVQHVPNLGKAQGLLGIVNAKKVWHENQNFWQDKGLPLEQEIIFASTGTKNPGDPKWKYVAALCGSDIQTNPPETNDAVELSGLEFTRSIDQWPEQELVQIIEKQVNMDHLEKILMQEGIEKFATPQIDLINTVEKRI